MFDAVEKSAEISRKSSDAFVRTALCVEPRDGVLFVFLPPLTHVEHWLDLVAALEATAAKLDQPIAIEG